MTNRRAAARIPASEAGFDAATLRPGFPVQVVDVSARGLQVESERPLRPGRRVHVRLRCGAQVVALSGVVLRCRVWALRHDAVVYRGALCFDHPHAGLGSASLAAESGAAGAAVKYPDEQEWRPPQESVGC